MDDDASSAHLIRVDGDTLAESAISSRSLALVGQSLKADTASLTSLPKMRHTMGCETWGR
jgi:hypothetical protein